MYTTVFGNVGYCLMKLFGLVPIKKNKIVFQSFYGAYESDNPKCIYDAMRKKTLIMTLCGLCRIKM